MSKRLVLVVIWLAILVYPVLANEDVILDWHAWIRPDGLPLESAGIYLLRRKKRYFAGYL